MFIYCENNPIMRTDPSGMFWKEVGSFLSKTWKKIKTWAKRTFGAGVTVVCENKDETEMVFNGVNAFITVKTGTKWSNTTFKKGDSSKLVSVYAQGRADNWLVSSAGIKINIENFTCNISVGLDDIGISGSVKNGETTETYGFRADFSQFKVGCEGSITAKWDDGTDETSYTNYSVTGWGIIAAYIFITTGQWIPTPQAQTAQ